METIHQSNHQNLIESGVPFDKESRENYFEMHQKALINLSLVDDELEELEVLVQE